MSRGYPPGVPLASLAVTSVAVLVALVALTASTLLTRRVRRLERALVTSGPVTVAAVRTGDTVRRELDALGRQVAQVQADVATSLRHVAVVRYDAFGDLAGRLSFSAALLDDAGDGVVLTSINGRSETRTYAKGVAAGASGHPLSPEEKEAVARAQAARPALERAG